MLVRRRYILYQEAGTSDMEFEGPDGKRRKLDNVEDRNKHPLQVDKLNEKRREHPILRDFVRDKRCVLAGLSEHHVVAIRLYTTEAFKTMVGPLRDAAHARDVGVALREIAMSKRNGVLSRTRVCDLHEAILQSFDEEEEEGTVRVVGTVLLPSGKALDQEDPNAELEGAGLPPRDKLMVRLLPHSHDQPAAELRCEVLRPYLYPATMAFLDDALHKLRLAANSGTESVRSPGAKPPGTAASSHDLVLWRGLKDVSPEHYLGKWGVEVAPMSSTDQLKVAIGYTRKMRVRCHD